jgi:hypothetical protein
MIIHVKTGSFTYDSAIGFDTALSPCTENILYIKNNSLLKGGIQDLKKLSKKRG